MLLLSSCSSTKYVGDGQYLLESVSIRGDLGEVDASDCQDYVRQQPNASVLGIFHPNLSIYSLSRPNKNNWFNNWLRKIGEAPVVFDTAQTARTTEQLRLYMNNRGYFDATVRDSVTITGKKKCAVRYTIDAGEPYRISHIGHNIADDTIRQIIMADSAASLIRLNDAFDVEKHDAERSRITRQLNEAGYFQFGKDYIYFLADSSISSHQVMDSLVLIDNIGDNYQDIAEKHKKAMVDEVWIVVNRAGEMPIDLNEMDYDTTSVEGIHIAYRRTLPFNKKLMSSSCFVRPGKLYNVVEVEHTQTRFQLLQLFGETNLRFVLQNDSTNSEYDHLICLLTTTVSKQQSYSVGIEGTNSSGNLGVAGSIGYRHANIFRKAEQLDVKYRLATQNQFAHDGKERFFTVETGVDVGLTFPRFILPGFSMSRLDRYRSTSTRLNLSFDYQKRPDFTKTAISASYGYLWFGHSRQVRHTLTPVELNIVNVPKISDDFKSYIENTYLKYSYTDHFIFAANYTYLFDQSTGIAEPENALYARFSLETAGNFLSLLTAGSSKAEDGMKQIFGIDYAQYVKTDIEVRYQLCDFWGNRLVFRAFGGIGVPYGNAKSLPFEKSYYVGGANSVRAWMVRGLGPGSSSNDNGLRYSNSTGDIRLEANAEYRYNIVSILEGAIFADAGNIWHLKKTSDDPDAVFTKNFLDQIAVGSGLGIRFNFGYFVLRLDAAVKLRDPSVTDGSPWVIAHKRLTGSDINYNFAIGYPF